jgi:hypothetical protein
MGVSGGSSSSKPVDMTPQAFKGLQAPYAAVLGQLLGFNITNPDGSSTNPVSFTYPGGQFTGQGGTGAQTGAGQVYRPGGGGGNNATRISGAGGSSNAGVGPTNFSGGNRTPTQGQPGFTVTNPNLGTGNPNDILNGIPTYQGPLTANLGANEQSILDMLMGNANSTGSSTSGTGLDPATSSFLQSVMQPGYVPGNTTPDSLNAFAQMLQGAHQTAAYDPNSENPFLQAAIKSAQQPTLQGLTETLTQALPGRFTQAGQFNQPQGSSAFDRAAALATRGASDTLGNIATNLSYQNMNDQLQRSFQANQSARAAEDTGLQGQLTRDQQSNQAAQDRQVQAAGIAPQVSSTQVNNMVSNLQAQALPRLIQEYGIERGMTEFNNRVNSLLGVLGIAGGTTQPTVSQQSKSSQAGISLK